MGFFTRLGRIRSPLDYAFRLGVLLVLAGLLNHLRDMVITPDKIKPLLENVRDAAFVGLPLVALGLVLLVRLGNLSRELERQARTDQLTQLPNRRAFFDEAEGFHGLQTCVAIIDIDHFKRVNDTYGHLVGDGCLYAVGQYLKDWAGPDNLICRYGGEEFAVLLRSTTPQAALNDARRIAKGRMFEVENQAVTITLSIGIAKWGASETLDTALNNADQALYSAKNAGRARAEPYPLRPPHGGAWAA